MDDLRQSATGSAPWRGGVCLNGWIYVLGGNIGFSATTTVWRSQVLAGGANGAFEVVTELGGTPDVVLATKRAFHSVHVVVVAGRGDGTTLASVEYARINGDGTMQPFTIDNSPVPTPRREHDGDVVGSTIYITGGSDGTDPLGDVPSVAIAGSCTAGTGICLAAWSSIADFGSVTAPRYGHSTVAYQNWLYLVGGWDGAATISDAWFIDP